MAFGIDLQTYHHAYGIALATRVLKVIGYRLDVRCELKLAVPGGDVCNLHVVATETIQFTATIQDITKPRKLRQEASFNLLSRD